MSTYRPGFVKMQRLILLKLWFKMLTIYWERQIYIYNHNAEKIKIKSPKIYKQKRFWQLREMWKIWNFSGVCYHLLSGQLKYIYPNKYAISFSDNLLTFLFWSCWHLTIKRAVKKGFSYNRKLNFFFFLRKFKRKYLCILAILEKSDFPDNITTQKLESKHTGKEKMLKIFQVYNYLLNTCDSARKYVKLSRETELSLYLG